MERVFGAELGECAGELGAGEACAVGAVCGSDHDEPAVAVGGGCDGWAELLGVPLVVGDVAGFGEQGDAVVTTWGLPEMAGAADCAAR